MRTSRSFLAALALLAPLPLQAAQAVSLDLQQAVERALAANPGLAASQAQVDASEALRRSALGAMLPRVDTGLHVARSDSPITAFGAKLLQQRFSQQDFDPARLNQPNAITNYQTTLRLTLPVYQGGALRSTLAMREHNSRAATADYGSTKQRLLYNVIAAFARAQRAAAMLAARRQAERAAAAHFEATRALRRRGLAIDSDVLTAKVHLLDAGVAVRQAEDEQANALDGLRVLLNLEPGTPLQLQGQGALVEEQARSLADWQEMALNHRPDMQALRARLDAARAGIGVARAGFRPHISLMAQEEWNNDVPALKHRFATVGGVLQFNAFAGGADKAKVEAAQAAAARLNYALAEQRQRIRAEVAAAWRALRESRARLLARQQGEQQSREALRILTLRHKAGLEKTADLLAAQARLDAARADTIHARFDVIVADARLYLAAGLLTPEVLR